VGDAALGLAWGPVLEKGAVFAVADTPAGSELRAAVVVAGVLVGKTLKGEEEEEEEEHSSGAPEELTCWNALGEAGTGSTARPAHFVLAGLSDFLDSGGEAAHILGHLGGQHGDMSGNHLHSRTLGFRDLHFAERAAYFAAFRLAADDRNRRPERWPSL